MADERDLEALAAAFQALALSRDEWTHRAHLAVGLWHVARFGPEVALDRLRTGIRALNERNGVANTPTGGYHETITRAYVELLAAFLARRGVPVPVVHGSTQDDCDALLDSPIADRSALLVHWSRDRLMSSQARAVWVEPDILPLPVRQL